MNPIKMVKFRFLMLVIAFLISLIFILYPYHYTMGAFIFIAQPIFIGVIVLYFSRIIRLYLRKDRDQNKPTKVK